jgi:regulator of cell morphogenesis and NO signaling
LIPIDPDSTLGDIVTARPAAARVFERHDLDYCCGGSQTLREACAAQQVDEAVVTAEVAEASVDDDPVPLTALGLVQLVDHIEATHHAPLWVDLHRLDELLQKLVRVHGERHPELDAVHAAFRSLRVTLEPHLRDEERTVFPALRQLAVTASREGTPHGLFEAIDDLADEHELAGATLAHIRELTDGYRVPPDGCASYRACYEGLAELEADLHLHVHKENNVLFPAADRVARRLVQSSR